MLSLPERQLRQWEHHGLITPAESFSLRDLVALRTLRTLRQDRVPLPTIRLALAALRSRLQNVDDPLRELKVIADGKRVRVEVAGQSMEPVSGQLLFNFDGAELRRLLSFPGQKTTRKNDPRARKDAAEEMFLRGLALEKQGNIPDAVKAYEAAVDMDPGSAASWLNLGTIHFHGHQFKRAESCYNRALEADPAYALAHFNIGNLYDERGDYDRALDHYKRAIAVNPQYADAHYNLALLHQGAGQVMESVRHWKIYLKLDPGSSWAHIARRELEKLRRSAIVQSAGRRLSPVKALD